MASSVSLETEWAEAGEGESFKELHDAIAEGKAELFKADNPGVQYGKFLRDFCSQNMLIKFADSAIRPTKTDF